MPVMESIRKTTDSALMRVMFGAIVLVFLFWGIGANGPTSQVVAEVDGDRITDTEFQRVMRNLSRSQSNMDEDELNAIARDVIAELIQQRTLLHEAERVGLQVSDQEIARQVLQIDAFKDAGGKFNTELYERTLKRMGLSRGRFEDDIRKQLMISKLEQLAAASVTVSEGRAKAQFFKENTRLSLKWAFVPDDALLHLVPVDDTTVQAYIAASPEAIKAAYEGEYANRYNRPQKAAISTILLRTDIDGGRVEEDALRTRLEGVLTRARAGEDFALLAREWSEDLTAVNGGQLGMMAEGQMEQGVSAAVFAAGAGGITDILRTTRGLQIVQVQEVIPAEVTPLEEAQAEIARELIAREGVERFSEEHLAKLTADWKASGAAPTSELAALGVLLQESMPMSPSRPQLRGVGESPALQAALSAATEAGVLEGSFVAPGGRVVAEIVTWSGADEAGYAAEGPALKARLAYMSQMDFLDRWRSSLVAQADVNQLYTP